MPRRSARWVPWVLFLGEFDGIIPWVFSMGLTAAVEVVGALTMFLVAGFIVGVAGLGAR